MGYKAEPLILRDFSGGVNTFVNDAVMAGNQLRFAINMYHDPKNGQYGSLTSRHGFNTLDVLDEDADPINTDIAGIDATDYHAGFHVRGADSIISVIQESDATDCYAYHFDGTDWADIGTTPFNWGQNGKVRMVTFVDYTFGANGTYVRSWDGNTANDWGTTNLTSAPTGSLLEVYKDRLYVAGDPSETSRVYFSSIPDASLALTWSTSEDYFDVDPDDGDSIVALERNGPILLIFKQHSTYVWDGTSLNKLYEYGTISQETVKTVKGKTLFAGTNEKGVSLYLYDGGVPADISDPVRGWLRYFELTDFGALTNTGMFIYGDNIIYQIHDVVRDGIEYYNMGLAYNVTTNRWGEISIDKVGSSDNNNYFIFSDLYREADTGTDGFTRLSSSIEHVYTVIAGGPLSSSSAADDQITPVIWSNPSDDFNEASGDFLSSTDNGRPIPILIQLPTLDWGSKVRSKRINKFAVFARGNTGFATVQVRVHGDDTGERGNVVEGLRNDGWRTLGGLTDDVTVFSTKLRGQWFDFRIVGSNAGDPFIFEGFEFFDVYMEEYE